MEEAGNQKLVHGLRDNVLGPPPEWYQVVPFQHQLYE
jgi:hypothetical protein